MAVACWCIAADGKKTVGRFVHREFRPVKAKTNR